MKVLVSTLIYLLLSSVCAYGQSDDTNASQEVQRLVRKRNSEMVLRASSSRSPSVMQIPYQEDISPTGAQTCIIKETL